MKKVGIVILLCSVLTVLGGCTRTEKHVAAGAAVGAVAGHIIGGDTGTIIGAGVGAASGAIISDRTK
ncbi:YMGG-like glycine zipper-containing protein [Fusobacterium sp.]|uniref:YMGG-like glycine zipper-containing protein n=1 Tax=Fusobacterium sp. TaxID=68766 RepID=UPI0025C57166|nr:YMGG-like glycine zipper-containing protein [Fusobacterium sp.]